MFFFGTLAVKNTFAQGLFYHWSLTGNNSDSSYFLGTTNAADLRFKTNNIQQMVLTSSGNLGLGVLNPVHRLEVAGVIKADSIFATSFNLNTIHVTDNLKVGNTIYFNGNVVNPNPGGSSYDEITSSHGKLAFASTASGPGNYPGHIKIGIGTNDPKKALHILTFHDYVNPSGSHYGIRLEDHAAVIPNVTPPTTSVAWDIESRANGGTLKIKEGNMTAMTFRKDGRIEFNSPSGPHRMFISSNGNVGINVNTPQAKLHIVGPPNEITLDVCGWIRGKEVIVETGWCDYVFEDNYKLMPLKELEKFLKANKHLPEIPPAREVENNGLELAKINKLMMLKIEELTLYLIEQNKKIEELEKQVEELKK